MAQSRILIVDDDAAIRGLLRVVAERARVQADEASDGVRALELLSAHSYDIVLLDLSMPRLNGFDFIERLRHKSVRPAVIVLSALDRVNFTDLDPSVVHCILRKPFDLDLLMAMIVSISETMQKQRLAAPEQRAAEARL